MTNKYSVLKNDEKKIFQTFTKQFQKLIDHLEDVCKKFKEAYDSEKLFDEALKIDKQNIMIMQDIVDESIWLIQKDEPRADHLRFFISLINSCSNLKRISAYLVNFGKFYYKHNASINQVYRQGICNLFELTITHVKKIFVIFEKNPQAINEEDYLKIFDDFLKVYKKDSSELIASTIKKDRELNPNFILAVVVVIKNFDRYLDNTIYIIENFSDF